MSKRDSKDERKSPAGRKARTFGRDEREARETQRRATAYGRARGIS